jgi:L-type amino acid transporter 9
MRTRHQSPPQRRSHFLGDDLQQHLTVLSHQPNNSQFDMHLQFLSRCRSAAASSPALRRSTAMYPRLEPHCLSGRLLSWAGAASFAELGAALPLNGGMQEYLRYIFGDTFAWICAWVYIMAVKPSSMAIQSIVIAESIGSVSSSEPLPGWLLKLIAAVAFVSMVLLNSINTKFTLRLSESFTVFKISTVGLIVLGGFTAVVAHLVDPNSTLSGTSDWYSKNWFATRPTVSEGHIINWDSISTWERYGHYCAAIYGGLWAYDGWDNVSTSHIELETFEGASHH